MDFAGRQERLAQAMADARLDAFLVSHMANVRYLCGFTGSSGALAVGRTKEALRAAFFTDGRYTQQAKEQVKGAEVAIAQGPALTEAMAWLRKQRVKRIGFEGLHMSVAVREALAPSGEVKMVATRELVEKLRMVKEPGEVAAIRAAVMLASSVFETVLQSIKPEVPESRVAAELEYMCRRLGAEGMSFATLVSAGTRSALPHGVASSAPIPAKGFVILDFGVILGGYCSDMTRTVHVGAIDRKSRRMYEAVREAQRAGVEAVRAGVMPSEVDRAARKVLEKAGLGKYFTHSTGHGVGLEIHEPPGLRKAAKRKAGRRKTGSPGSPKEMPLEAGMVITIEPGAYVPGVGGVRIEDMVLVTATGCEVLTPTTKELILL
ncbi:MAG TPA: Xaa-Pro peptidase family protein [Terriglobales bacterium]|nr:Xaa-Pro peptidase family protein [Terriglobales bacterium]